VTKKSYKDSPYFLSTCFLFEKEEEFICKEKQGLVPCVVFSSAFPRSTVKVGNRG
jgi:hypothetical protein